LWAGQDLEGQRDPFGDSLESRASTALCLCFCTPHASEIPRTDPLVQVDYARVVDLDIGASKSDICAIKVVSAAVDRDLGAYAEVIKRESGHSITRRIDRSDAEAIYGTDRAFRKFRPQSSQHRTG
jgi:hypothetical protein